MKKIKYIVIGIVIGIIIVGSVSVYAIEAVIDSREVSYDNEISHGSFTDVQGSIDELYERSGILKEKWKDPILNGADPVFDSTNKMIPVEIKRDGTVKYANLYTKWYEYEDKRWANAVILTGDGKNKNYKTGDKIDEADIESYFVWIPRYKYKIWDLGEYTSIYKLGDLKDSIDTAESNFALRNFNNRSRLIDIVFGDTAEIEKMQQSEAKLNQYYTHPAFTLGDTQLNGIWVGKFETGYKDAKTTADAQKDVIDSSKIIVKPNVYSWRNQTVGKMFKTALGYENGLGSHMMKNTEWGAVAYLSHSVYGIGTEVNINNNSEYKTGYSAAANTDQSSNPGTSGTETDVTQAWNTTTGYLASTTGNITGVYDMSGGAWEYMAAYVEGCPDNSELTSELSNNAKYFDKYSASSTVTSYNQRILGDATGEMGPFYYYYDNDKGSRSHNTWYADYSDFVACDVPWFSRGGGFTNGVLGGQLSFARDVGGAKGLGSRLVLTCY